MQISVEKIIQMVTAEVLKELKKLGVEIVSATGSVDDKFLVRTPCDKNLSSTDRFCYRICG